MRVFVHTKALFAVLATLVLTASPSRAEDAGATGVIVETVDGTVIIGTLPADLELVLVRPDGQTKIAAAKVRRLSVSGVSEKQAEELAAAVGSIAERWQRDEFEIRDAAMEEALKLPGAAAPCFSRLKTHKDAEVAARAEGVLEALRARGELFDPRDLVDASGEVLRGRLALKTLKLATALGPVEIALGDVRTLRRSDVPEAVPPPENEDEWPPMPATAPERKPADGAVAVVVRLPGGWRLVGELALDALPLVDEKGAKVSTDRLLRVVPDKEAPGFFRVARGGAVPVRVRIDVREIRIVASGRIWEVSVGLLESLDVGPLRRSGGIEQLVAAVLKAAATGEPPPDQRFWVHINDQPANPWDSEGKKGMTWILKQVQGDACLVGTDGASNAYGGDTSIEMELPILALRPGDLPPPDGLDVSDSYSGWAGGEVRLTRPVKGSELKSLADANALIEAEFGKGWRMAEFHDTNTLGWNWWAYWVEQGSGKK